MSTTNRVILVTGIPRSASTLAFNICRILFNQCQAGAKPYWINDVPVTLSIGKVYLLKIHDYDPLIAALPLTFIHTTRNLKEIASSTTVRDQIEPSIEEIKTFRNWDIKWKQKADVVFDYNHVLDVKKTIHELAHLLQVEVQSTEKIIEEIELLQEPTNDVYDKTTQLNQRHRTRAGTKWKKILSEKLIKAIDELD